MNIEKHLKELTVFVRQTKGEAVALKFYVDYVQPIKQYFRKK